MTTNKARMSSKARIILDNPASRRALYFHIASGSTESKKIKVGDKEFVVKTKPSTAKAAA